MPTLGLPKIRRSIQLPADWPGYTIILNHPRGWGGKPKGSLVDSRVAEISHDIGNPFFFARVRQSAAYSRLAGGRPTKHRIQLECNASNRNHRQGG